MKIFVGYPFFYEGEDKYTNTVKLFTSSVLKMVTQAHLIFKFLEDEDPIEISNDLIRLIVEFCIYYQEKFPV